VRGSYTVPPKLLYKTDWASVHLLGFSTLVVNRPDLYLLLLALHMCEPGCSLHGAFFGVFEKLGGSVSWFWASLGCLTLRHSACVVKSLVCSVLPECRARYTPQCAARLLSVVRIVRCASHVSSPCTFQVKGFCGLGSLSRSIPDCFVQANT
jgi:hypothetical protein